MKSLKEHLNESLLVEDEIQRLGIWHRHRDNSFSVYISEKNFNKISKNKTITTPYPNKSIKILDNNTNIKCHVIPNGSTAFITKMKDEEKTWYLIGDPQKYKNETIFVIKLYSTNKESSSIQDTISFPTFELLNHFGYKSKYGVPKNSIGMLDVSGNLGSYAHAFTGEALNKIKQVLKFIGFEIVEK
jgi:hypothetical protein